MLQVGDIAGIYEQLGNNTQRIWKLLAYAGRYGHQPVDVSRRLTVKELGKLAECVAELIREENEAGATPRED